MLEQSSVWLNIVVASIPNSRFGADSRSFAHLYSSPDYTANILGRRRSSHSSNNTIVLSNMCQSKKWPDKTEKMQTHHGDSKNQKRKEKANDLAKPLLGKILLLNMKPVLQLQSHRCWIKEDENIVV